MYIVVFLMEFEVFWNLGKYGFEKMEWNVYELRLDI